MSLEELKDLLDTTDLPVSYRAFPAGKAPSLPYICYLCSYSNNFTADDRVYQKITHINVELYTREKRPDLEGKLETVLADLCWEKAEEYLDDEKCYEIIYEIEV